jgi:uncharacterized protein
MKTVLITGGSGLIGKRLSQKLTDKGYRVRLLGRKIHENIVYDQFVWNVAIQSVNDAAFKNCDYIIHLAGANLAEGRWTKSRKEEIVNSRIKSTQLLFNAAMRLKLDLKAFISSSAIGYYGAITTERIFEESDSPADEFIGQLCMQWEQEINSFERIRVRTVKLRTGVVFSPVDGPLAKMAMPVKHGLGAGLGMGSQYLPWIHLDDLCDMYIKALEDEDIYGVYNAVSPQHVTNIEVMKAIGNAVGRKVWLPLIPSFLLKLAFGKMAVIFLEGSRVSSSKIQQTGFTFRYPTLDLALKNLLKTKD